jgi:hypothetical protein
MTIVGRKDFEPNTLQELVDYVKANADTVTYANAGCRLSLNHRRSGGRSPCFSSASPFGGLASRPHFSAQFCSQLSQVSERPWSLEDLLPQIDLRLQALAMCLGRRKVV